MTTRANRSRPRAPAVRRTCPARGLPAVRVAALPPLTTRTGAATMPLPTLSEITMRPAVVAAPGRAALPAAPPAASGPVPGRAYAITEGPRRSAAACSAEPSWGAAWSCR